MDCDGNKQCAGGSRRASAVQAYICKKMGLEEGYSLFEDNTV